MQENKKYISFSELEESLLRMRDSCVSSVYVGFYHQHAKKYPSQIAEIYFGMGFDAGMAYALRDLRSAIVERLEITLEKNEAGNKI